MLEFPTDRVGQRIGAAVPSGIWARTTTAVLLAAVAGLFLWAGTVWFALIVAVIGSVMAWEWGRVVRGQPALDLPFWLHAGVVATAVVLTAGELPAMAVAVTLVGAVVMFALRLGRHGRLSAFGVIYLALPAIALVWLRGSGPYGFVAVGFIITVVAASDTFAMVFGKLIGGARLWPAISPNKTWAGAIGGAVSASLAAVVLVALFVAGASPLAASAIGLVISIAAQAGDIFESALKRRTGIKDASQLLPGHGGFLDRMDGLIAAVLVAIALGVALDGAAPARALLGL